MGLSNNLISQFVKVTDDSTDDNSEQKSYGTIHEIDGKKYVQIDGSNILTPYFSTSMVKDGDRVMVQVKDHNAVVTGNISSPSIRNGDFEAEVQNTADRFTATYANIENLSAEQGRFEELTTNRFTAAEATIDTLSVREADFENATTKNFEATNATITNLSSDFANFKIVTTDSLTANKAKIEVIEGDLADYKEVTTNKFTAVDADISRIEIDKANITLENVDTSYIGTLFNRVGLIDRATIVDGHITGFLDAVEINADNITAGTLIADRLLLKGTENGLLYQLNNLGELTSTNVDTLDGSILTKRTVTADKLVAKSITANELDANCITAEKILANAITADKIAANAITAEKILANAITADKIAANAITAEKILANAITADKIASGAITSNKIASGAITADKIAANAITADKLAAGSITSDQMAAKDLHISGNVYSSDNLFAEKGNVAAVEGDVIAKFNYETHSGIYLSAVDKKSKENEEKIVNLLNYINSEASNRADADNAIKSLINSEASNRADADNAIKSLINSEASNRAYADNAIKSKRIRTDTLINGVSINSGSYVTVKTNHSMSNYEAVFAFVSFGAHIINSVIYPRAWFVPGASYNILEIDWHYGTNLACWNTLKYTATDTFYVGGGGYGGSAAVYLIGLLWY